MKHRKILIGCLTASLFFHALALLFFQRYSLWFSSSSKVEHHESWLSFIDKKERNQILKESFSFSEPKKIEPLKAQKEQNSSLFFHFSKDLFNDHSTTSKNTAAFPIHDHLIKKSVFPTFNLPTTPSIDLLDHLPKDLIVPISEKKKVNSISPFPIQSQLNFSSSIPEASLDPPEMPPSFSELIKTELSDTLEREKVPNMIPIPKLPSFPTLSELNTASYSDFFDADLVFLPKEEGEGYIFAITLIPRADLNLPRFRQHFTFLIDRSNSIQQDRLVATKSALHRSLQALLPEDTFNIIAFDSKIEKMSPNPLPCVKRSFAIAEEFLEKIYLGSFFSSSDLYKPLLLTVPSQIAENEIHTAILLTDGESLVKKSNQFSLLSTWTQYNQGHISLFALGMNDPQSAVLEAVTTLNRGKLLNSNSNRGLRRKLLKLLNTIQNPIAKDLVCSAMSRSKIKLYPEANQMPYLYLNQPYVILGETDLLDDFILFIQGKLKDRWLNIRKNISFVNARKGNKSLKQEYALQKAYHLYERSLREENPQLIADVQKLLKPYELDSPFR